MAYVVPVSNNVNYDFGSMPEPPDQVEGRHAGTSFSRVRGSYLGTKKEKRHKESKY